MSLNSTHSPPFALLHRPNVLTLQTLRMDGVLQTKNYTCGYASVLMVARFLGNPMPKEDIYEMLETDRTGTSQSKIIETLRTLGFSASIRYDLELDGISKMIQSGKPAIAYLVDEEHWVVVYGCDVTNQKLYIADPRPGFKCEYSWSAKKKALNGFGIVCSSKQRVQQESKVSEAETSQLLFNFGS